MKDEILYPRGVDTARVIQVIETQAARGSGAADQISRMVTQYWSLDGELLAERDPYTDGQELAKVIHEHRAFCINGEDGNVMN